MSDDGMCPCGDKLAVYVFDTTRGARVVVHPDGAPAQAFRCNDCSPARWWQRDDANAPWREWIPSGPEQ